MSSLNKIQQKRSKKSKDFLSSCVLFFIIFLFLNFSVSVIGNIVNAAGSNIPPPLEFTDADGDGFPDVSLGTDEAYATAQAIMPVIKTVSPEEKKAAEKAAKKAQNAEKWKVRWEKLIKTVQERGSNTLAKAVSTALNQMAFDLATYIGSGREGQKPMFITENWEEYYLNIADNAAGTFIEELGKEGIFGKKFNLCEPDFNVKWKIGLGLRNQVRPEMKKPACTFMKMTKNWEEAMRGNDFLTQFQDMFNPQSNDLGIALSLQTKMADNIDLLKDTKAKDRVEGSGWLDPRNIAGRLTGVPGQAKSEKEQIEQIQAGKFGQFTGDALVDASNVFINQLAITAYNKLMRKASEDKGPSTEKYPGNWGGLDDYAGQPYNEGVSGAKDRLAGLIEPNFTVRGDYNILTELTMCPDPTKAGPTNCVIDDKFSLAITERKTVGEALGSYLKKDGIFGFSSAGVEPNYLEGFPYRSMIILRKFRILPVGWEVAGQYIKDHSKDISGDLTDVGRNNTLEKMVACFASDDDFKGYDATWCRGLVDPNWVLKAPLNYCKREGSGNEILSAETSGDGASSQLTIARNDEYCADEQSCIKEKNNGQCDIYGYCTEERREWRFGNDVKTCEPKYNTCQTFRGSAGETVSYLENTLNYGQCNVDNVGCLAYCASYNASTSKFTCNSTNVSTSTNNKIYLDKDVQTCEQTNEGCHKFIRLKTGLGVNLLTNSSFEEDFAGTIWDGMASTTDGYDGSKALQLSGNLLSGNLEEDITVNALVGESFSLSFAAKECAVGNNFQLADQTVVPLNAGTDWQTYETSYILPASSTTIKIKINSASCIIDTIKLERGDPTTYSSYGENGIVYQKYAPGYLSCDGINDPNECDKYVTDCKAEDVGCELYTSIKDNVKIPAQVRAKDYCPDVCVGYNTFIQSKSSFDSLSDSYFIPKTAKTCSAEAIGCDEFTNLDELGKGAEAKEYYSALRRCIKPDAGQCAEFYSWEGSDKSGFQLRVVKLKKAGENPEVTENDSVVCNEASYKYLSNNPSYQPDCRQFYNRAGQISYHLVNNTISCSEDCHPYRKTALSDDSSSTCSERKGTWDDDQSACIYMAIPGQGKICSASQNGCREYVGSTGNNIRFILNNNFEDLSNPTQDWMSISGTTVEQSSETAITPGHSLAVSVGNYSAGVVIGQTISAGQDYILSFEIKKGSATQLTAELTNNLATSTFATAILSSNNNWNSYKINLTNLDHEPNISEKLIIKANGNFFIDNIRLTEVVDHYYLIKDSWQTPDICDRDLNGAISPQFMLRCDAYNDRDNVLHNLRSFSDLCAESAVGCELMIDTKNSDNYKKEVFNDNDPSKITVLEDKIKYVVFDKSKQCNADDEGCQLLGKPYQYDTSLLYSNVYLKNKPDKYNEILCSSNAIGCQKWTAGNGDSYFKSPGDMVCDWRQITGKATDSWGWYKKKVKHCGGVNANSVCLTDNDCAIGVSCLETIDIVCPVDTLKTLGTGGASVSQPKDMWAGICPAREAGCTEYIDPISKFSMDIATATVKVEPNTVYIFKNGSINCNINNPIFDTVALQACITRNCSSQINRNNCINYYCSSAGDFMRDNYSNGVIYELINKNNLVAVNSLSATATSSKQFYTSDSVQCILTGTDVELRRAVVGYNLKQNMNAGDCNGMVDFEKGCVLFNERSQNGSSLSNLTFNANITENDGSGKTAEGDVNNNANKLLKVSPDRVCDKWLACETITQVAGVPGGVCEKVGVCNKFNDSGSCSRFISNTVKQNQTATSTITAEAMSNMSGYAKVGWANSSVSFYPNDYYPLGQASAIGLTASVLNGQFESVLYKNTITTDASGTESVIYNTEDPDWPTNWDCGYKGKEADEQTQKNLFKNSNCQILMASTTTSTTVLEKCKEIIKEIINEYKKINEIAQCEIIDDPIESQDEKICFKKDNNGDCYVYAPEGRNFVKLTADNKVSTLTSSVSIPVRYNQEYVLTAYVNTQRMNRGQAKIKIEEYKLIAIASSTTEELISSSTVISVDSSKPWTLEIGKIGGKAFKTQASTTKIKVILTASDNALGDYYFDDVKIRPVLESANYGVTNYGVNGKWYTPQSCRLYPKNDSLSCAYNDDSGMRYKGWYGHCLEYDRSPGDPDVCLLWWSAPPETSRVSEWCGDGKVNGEEDCDCGSNNGDKCNGIDTKISTGSNRLDQYSCNKCYWDDGWCGDGAVQTANGEHCDWNEKDMINPILNQQSCWKKATEFNHDGYTDYLHGSLGCNNHSNISSSTSESYKQCEFNKSGCSDNLVRPVVTAVQHRRKQCADAGGVVWAHASGVSPADNAGWQVTNDAGEIITDRVGNSTTLNGTEYPTVYFCRLPGGDCNSNGRTEWNKYGDWSTTQKVAEHRMGSGSKIESNCSEWKEDGYQCLGKDGVRNFGGDDRGNSYGWVSCNVLDHNFMNKKQESCTARHRWDKDGDGGSKDCNTSAKCSAIATITEIGCY
ncbi:MAG: hypothetical protein Q7T79_01910 [bacterium]|nr:hypothetical protein [bacterium]